MTPLANSSKEKRASLRYIRARHFLSLHDVRLEVGPHVTLLAGPNASGKSNLVDAISFVADALYDGADRAVGYRGVRATLNRHGGRASPWFSIGLGLESTVFEADYEFRIRITREGEVSISTERISGKTKYPRVRRFDFRLRDGNFHKPDNATISNTLSELDYSSDTLMLSVMGDSLAVANLITSSLMRTGRPSEESESVGQVIVDMTNFIGDMRLYRLFPNTMKEPRRHQPIDKLEEDGANLPSVLSGLIRKRKYAYWQLIAALNRVVPDIEDIRVREIGGYQYIQLKHNSLTNSSGSRGWLDLSNESDGTVRTLGLFVALYQDPPPSLICIEEPELSVHVGALGVLADSLNEVGLRSQIVFTTHSCEFLDYFGADSIRAVLSDRGRTRAGKLRHNQLSALKDALFTAGEIHRMEGLSTD